MLDSQFEMFASEFSGALILARQYAQLSGQHVWVNLEEQGPSRFSCLVRNPGSPANEFAIYVDHPRSGLDKKIRNQLIGMELPHPVQDRILDSPLTSTHAPNIIFTPHGASAATAVFSDGQTHAICAVISSQTGRIRLFSWDHDQSQWRDYF